MYLKYKFDTSQCDCAAYMNECKLEFIGKHKKDLEILCKCSKMFNRIAKYGFKNYFKNNDEARASFLQVDFVYKILKPHIQKSCFTIENITESILRYIIEVKPF